MDNLDDALGAAASWTNLVTAIIGLLAAAVALLAARRSGAPQKPRPPEEERPTPAVLIRPNRWQEALGWLPVLLFLSGTILGHYFGPDATLALWGTAFLLNLVMFLVDRSPTIRRSQVANLILTGLGVVYAAVMSVVMPVMDSFTGFLEKLAKAFSGT